MEVMKGYPDNYFDLAVVDPPYGLDFIHKGQIGNSKFIAKNWDIKPDKTYFDELFRISKNYIIWGANYFNGLFPNKSFIYWNKMNHDGKGDGELAITSFNIPNRYFGYMWDGNRYGFENGKIHGVGKKTIRIHPTQKPTKLYEWIYNNYAKKEFKVIDTHLGSGSNLIAADKFGISEFVGCEIDKDYFDSMIKRYELYKSQIKLF